MTSINSLRNTIGNEQWMRANEQDIKSIFPEEWEEITQTHAMRFGFKMKLLGIEWRTPQEYGAIMAYFSALGLMEHDKTLSRVRRKPNSVFAGAQGFHQKN